MIRVETTGVEISKPVSLGPLTLGSLDRRVMLHGRK